VCKSKPSSDVKNHVILLSKHVCTSIDRLHINRDEIETKQMFSHFLFIKETERRDIHLEIYCFVGAGASSSKSTPIPRVYKDYLYRAVHCKRDQIQNCNTYTRDTSSAASVIVHATRRYFTKKEKQMYIPYIYLLRNSRGAFIQFMFPFWLFRNT